MTNMEWLASRRRTTARLLIGTTAGAAIMLGMAGFDNGEQPMHDMSTASPGGAGGAFEQFQTRITPPAPPAWNPANIFKGSRAADPPRASEVGVSDAMAPPPSALQPSSPQPPVGILPPTTVAGSENVDKNANGMERSTGQVQVSAQPVSTFAVDVDTASYSNVRRMILAGQTPPPSTVRPEEMVNYFRYDLPKPSSGAPFSITSDVFVSPWHSEQRLLRVALNSRQISTARRPNANLVLLVDVSGSMEGDQKLGLLKRAFGDMVNNLKTGDRVSIVTYADSAKVVLRSTVDRAAIRRAIDGLSSGGGTNGGDGLALAYQQARAGRIPGGINRVMVASDGDFNIGSVSPTDLKALVERERRGGTTLTTLGVGMTDFNDDVMQTLADAGNGNAAYFDDDLEARKVLRDELESSIQVIAKDVKAQVEFNPAVVSSYRLIGYENRRLAERSFDDDGVDAGEIGSGHQVTAIYEITPVAGTAGAIDDVVARRRYEANRVRSETMGDGPVPAAAAASGEALSVKLRYKDPGGGGSRLLSRVVPASALATTGAPAGDAAFAVAVAGFGQHLAGSGPRPDQIIAVAGAQTDPLRREFLEIVQRSGAMTAAYVPQQIVAPPPVRYTPSAPQVRAPTFYENARGLGWTLALLSGILALAVAWLDQLIRRARDQIEPEAVQETSPAVERHASMETLDAAIHEALRLSALETRTVLGGLDAAARHATTAEVDTDLADEISVIVERHAPEYVNSYIAARRLADADGVQQIEADLRQTLEVMRTRLHDLVQAQGARDAKRLGTGGAFVRERHGTPQDALA